MINKSIHIQDTNSEQKSLKHELFGGKFEIETIILH